MKKQLSFLVGMFVMSSAVAATNSGMYGASVADLTHGPGTRTRTTVNYEKYETRESARTYKAQNPSVAVVRPNTANLYYTEPARRTAFVAAPTATVRAGAITSEARRKYYLAHPFFQPMQGKVGIVLDGAYETNKFDFHVPTVLSVPTDLNAAYKMNAMLAKLDVSYGVTDRFSILGMARYDSTKINLDWHDPTVSGDDISSSGLNLYGLGLQWRFVDNAEWIATLSGYYQYQVDTAHNFVLDLKGGYKIGRSTLYGLARGWYVKYNGNAYGIGVNDDHASMLLAYKVGSSNAMYLEGGVGIFSVLSEDWTANLEGVLGSYDWHNQFSVKAAIGWQPGDNFALNLYGKIALYDSANGKNIDMYWREPAASLPVLTNIGQAKIDGYSDYSIGLQAIFYF
jgi:hypothetical protein